MEGDQISQNIIDIRNNSRGFSLSWRRRFVGDGLENIQSRSVPATSDLRTIRVQTFSFLDNSGLSEVSSFKE